ncbi:hypothetical protein RMI40_31680 [Pseudomonas protegens]|uniref:hypothetical protein n=1 Tax=Pseudomonas protegens TaxID=380021 RepID=UPI00287E89F5|nr:hypothetical protein [Pseudomonas protegens]MDS9879400.1 hypothetical protein [Pseudomonas protegens]
MAALFMAGAQPAQPPSILAEEFPVKLSAFNDLTREFREVGVVIKHLVLADNKIFIEPSSVDLFSRRFGHELRGIRYSPAGRFTCNTVTVRGVDIAWYTLVKEQDQ